MSKEEDSSKRKLKDGVASKIGDGIAGTSVGIAKTIEEVAVAPIRIAGHAIDGVVQGVTDGIENSNNPLEAGTKPVVGGLIGGVQGVMKGIEKSADQIGKGIQEIGSNVSKVGETMSGKSLKSSEEE